MLLLALLQLASWNLGPFSRTGIPNPILAPTPKATFQCPMRNASVNWEHDHVFNPAAIEHNGKVYVLFRAEDDSGSGIGGHTSRIGIAASRDGIHFSKRSEPVLFPDSDAEKGYEWPGGCEDPRIVQGPDGRYVLTYTSWNRKLAHLCVATSDDLITWKKFGPAFGNSRFADVWSKSGAIVTRLDHNHVVAAKIDGKYWMYWGDDSVNIATSTNLIDWTPKTTSDGKLLAVLTKRHGKFDSDIVESGPPALLTKDGIVLIYNGKNADKGGDPSLGPGAYAAGQALFDPHHPDRLLQRCATYFLKPEAAQEKTGQYKAGTVFTEGLALLNGNWFLYYGEADSFVGVAVSR